MNNPRRHLARSPSRLATFALATMAALTLAACQTTGGSSTLSAENRALRLAENGDHADAASAYIGLASEAAGSDVDRLTMLAIEQWIVLTSDLSLRD